MSEHAGSQAPSAARASATNALAALAVIAAGTIVFLIAAPSAYAVYLAIHILAAVVWVGGGTTLAILAYMIENENDPRLLGRFSELAGKAGTRTYLPSSLVLLVFGFVLVSKGDWGYGHFWVIFAILGWAATFVLGIAFIRPLAAKVGKVIPERGVEHPESQALLRRLILIDRWQVALLLLVVVDMAAKPFSA